MNDFDLSPRPSNLRPAACGLGLVALPSTPANAKSLTDMPDLFIDQVAASLSARDLHSLAQTCTALHAVQGAQRQQVCRGIDRMVRRHLAAQPPSAAPCFVGLASLPAESLAARPYLPLEIRQKIALHLSPKDKQNLAEVLVHRLSSPVWHQMVHTAAQGYGFQSSPEAGERWGGYLRRLAAWPRCALKLSAVPIDDLLMAHLLFDRLAPDKILSQFKQRNVAFAAFDSLDDSSYFGPNMRLQREDIALFRHTEGWRTDRQVVMVALAHVHDLYSDMPLNLRSDPDLLRRALISSGEVFRFADEVLRSDREFALLAVQRTATAMREVVGKARCDIDVVFAAVRQDPRVYWMYPDCIEGDLRRNTTLWLLAIKAYACVDCAERIRPLIPRELMDDREVALEALAYNDFSLNNVSKRLRADRDIVIQAVMRHGNDLRYATPDLQNDCEVALQAIEKDSYAFRYVSWSLKQDVSFSLAALRRNKHAIYEIEQTHWNHSDIAVEISRIYPEKIFAILRRLSHDIPQDRQLMFRCLSR